MSDPGSVPEIRLTAEGPPVRRADQHVKKWSWVRSFMRAVAHMLEKVFGGHWVHRNHGALVGEFDGALSGVWPDYLESDADY